jgi:hypothetical protein
MVRRKDSPGASHRASLVVDYRPPRETHEVYRRAKERTEILATFSMKPRHLPNAMETRRWLKISNKLRSSWAASTARTAEGGEP